MPMKQCEKAGHFYDSAIHSQCPYCNSEFNNATRPLDPGVTMPPQDYADIDRTRAGGMPPRGPAEDDGRTQVVIKKELGVDPVVGWLVATNGSEKGRDYRIHSDNNFIGRHEKSDICIRGDETISREKHAIISYDTRDNKYYLSPGEGRSIIRHNDKSIFMTVELQAYDTVEIGRTQLVFIPLCSERFTWTK